MNSCKPLLLTFLLFLSIYSTARNWNSLSAWQLRDSMACVEAEPQVLSYCRELLSTPLTFNPYHLNAAIYVLDWVQHTYNYTFVFDQNLYNILKVETSLANRYVAALVLYAISDGYYANSIDLQVKAISRLLSYCEDKSNGVFISPQLQQYMDADKRGILEQYILQHLKSQF